MMQPPLTISSSALKTLHIEKAKETTFLLGNHFLKQHKQVQAGKNDWLYVAQIDKQKIVGAFRLDVQPTYFWIRNLFVDPNYRHHGIGTKLIQYALNETEQTPYFCFNTPLLMPFYQSLGFECLSPDELPETLRTRLLGYQENGKNLIAMRFKTS
ncbi:GNAT family N-acetyltransferase [Hydrogenovibrio sp. 3SP14C1]|uniref:GNAT family N-acetyltransferase n=1 Tax=Hydrogenovibrio sp. 3SP14C1 TaxID=3038774 RepID=UPI0024174794|nr:GNAT family N-acetyltransferase [Hydrogenovibrio sp. 3SP14C1]MDG4813482.1 GNAT family N-acetyltransferase [Hydrogenovibrio sp. 3SP14C1]